MITTFLKKLQEIKTSNLPDAQKELMILVLVAETDLDELIKLSKG